jgi:site-specific DNA recombinase
MIVRLTRAAYFCMYKYKTNNKEVPKKNRYILYARKSTTSEDRQVASIDSQIEVMKEVAKEHNLNVVEVMSEAGSGFKIGRTVFNQMIDKIERGEVEGIVVWKLSRLSRNPDDAGKIMGLLQRGEVKHIRTVERNWNPEDNVMMMYVEFGLTNQFSRDLSSDTRRGLTKKAERGWSPSATLPLGYNHNPYKALGDEEIVIDEEKFHLMQKGLKLVASERKTPSETLLYLQSQGLRGRRGGPIPQSTWYNLLSEPFYFGKFEFPKGSGQIYESKAPRAISEEEFNYIQFVLGKKNKPRPKKHFLPYTGMMVCGECGCSITAENKRKIQKSGKTHKYVYYHCTKKKGKCSQRCIEVNKLEEQFLDILSSIEIPQAFHEWTIAEIRSNQKKEIEDRGVSIERARQSYDESVTQIDNIVDKYLAGKVPEDYYQRKLSEYEKMKETRKQVLDGIDMGINERIDAINEDLKFAVVARSKFINGDDRTRKAIISRLGSNLILNDQILAIELKSPLAGIKSIASDAVIAYKRFEPLEKLDNRIKYESYMSQSPEMGE